MFKGFDKQNNLKPFKYVRWQLTFLQGQVFDTCRIESKALSQIVGAQVFLKFEHLQLTSVPWPAATASSSYG